MTIKDALAFGTKQLNPTSLKLRGTRKIDSPQLDAAILLSDVIKKPKEFLYTHPEKKLTPAQIKKYKKFISRRAKHEPLAYITGKKEFYGFEFAVSPAALIPRPDTEALITAVINATMNYDNDYNIIDIGTGSGAIAITLKKLLPASTRSNRGEPKAQVFASDINPRSLVLARKNAKHLGTKIIFKKGDLLSPFKSLLAGAWHPLVITANLPYLSRAEWQKTAPEVKKYEPRGALVGGKTGTEIYEKLFREIAGSYPSLYKREAGRDFDFNKIPLNPPFSKGEIYLFIEIGHSQKSAIAKLAKKILRPQKIEFFKDLAGKWRVAKIVVSSK